jgi:hypothetical protein
MAEEDKVELPDTDVTVSSSDTPDQDVDQTAAEPSEPQSMLEAVEAAVSPEGDPSDPDSKDAEKATDPKDPDLAATTDEDGKPKDGPDASTSEEDTAIPDGDPTDEEMANYSKKANSRIRDLVEQRNQARAGSDRVEPIMSFLEQNNIPQQDLDVILDLTARITNGDFAGFLQGVEPYVNLAMQYTGQALPADLQQQVQQGYVSPEIAKELASRRAMETVTSARSQTKQNADAQQLQGMKADNIRTAVVDWEKKIAISDPDYALKADSVRRTAQALMHEKGAPQNPQEALQTVKAAYDEVNVQMKRMRPAPKATSRSPNATGNGSKPPVAEPKSMMEAAMAGLEAHRAT